MAEAAGGMKKLVQPRVEDLLRFADGSRPSIGLGILRRLAVAALTAIWAHNLGILVGHLVEERGKRLAAVIAQNINRLIAHNLFSSRCIYSGEHFASRFILPPRRATCLAPPPIE